MIKKSIKQETRTFVNIYAPNIRGKINSNTVIVGDFNTPPTSVFRSSRQQLNKETAALNDTLHWVILTDII